MFNTHVGNVVKHNRCLCKLNNQKITIKPGETKLKMIVIQKTKLKQIQISLNKSDIRDKL